MNSTIRLIGSSDSISELTLLIRRAYKVLADMGFNYTGTYQDDATTLDRIARGECYVMVEESRIIGTIMLYPPQSFSGIGGGQWYAHPAVASCGQFAVEPKLQRTGLGSNLLDFVERRASVIGARELALDTSEGAANLIRFYTNRGYRFIEFVQWEGKTYRSVVLSKTLHHD